jgi:multidrug resistance efflux pump
MILSALIGFVVFCASYSILVWRKRRQSTPGSNRLRRWSVTFLVLGGLGICTTFALREAVRADGMLKGDGLHAIRAPADMRIVQLADEGSAVKGGDILARYTSPQALAEIEQAEFARDVLKSERAKLELESLPVNPDKARKHELAAADRRALRTTLAFAAPNVKVAVRDITHNIVIQRDNLAKIADDLQSTKGDLNQAIAKRDTARKQLKRERDLAAKQQFSTSELNDREKEVFALEAEVAKQQKRQAAIEERQRQAKEDLGLLEKLSADQTKGLDGDSQTIVKQLTEAEEAVLKAERDLADDARTAGYRRQTDIEGFDLKIRQAEAQVLAKRDKLEEKAPFDGMVIYRHASPGTALNSAPILVFSPPEGLRFRFRVREDQVEALRNAGSVTIELDEAGNSVEQRFPGKFLSAAPLAREPGMSVVELDCQAPPETVAALAEGKLVKARFSWRPPLVNLWSFPIAIVLLILGVVGLGLSRIGDLRSGWSNSDSPAPVDEEDAIVSYVRAPVGKIGDTVEARDTIPERPLLPNVPREVPLEPWEHPVGVRLREAIIQEEVPYELLSAIETAIELEDEGAVEPLREALRRAPTVPRHARDLIAQLNRDDSGDDMAKIQRRCLAQRLAFLFEAVGIDLSEKPRVTAPRPPRN